VPLDNWTVEEADEAEDEVVVSEVDGELDVLEGEALVLWCIIDMSILSSFGYEFSP